MIQTIYNIGTLLLLSVIVHELGHYYYLKGVLNYSPVVRIENFKLKLGYPLDYRMLTPEQYVYLNYAGILAGYITLAGGFYLLNKTLLTLLVLPPLVIYSIGCKTDFKNIWGAFRK